MENRLIRSEMVAGTFRMAAKRHFASSDLCSSIALRIAEDAEVLEVAGLANPGQFPPYLMLAAVHSLLLKNTDVVLAQFFPSVSGKPVPKIDPYPAFRDFVLGARDQITELIRTAHVNKSVLKRSACLRALLVKIATENAWDRVHLVDIGCGVGLNLLMDYWRITYQGAGDVGPVASPVHFSIELRGGKTPPLDNMPEILSRTGIDLDYFDLTNEAQKQWILGNLFPDHLDTFDATKRALPVLIKHTPRILVGDAGVELARVLPELSGRDPVIIMHSLAHHQMKLEQKRAVYQAIKRASITRPILSIGMELFDTKCLLSIDTSDESEPIVAGEADDDANWMLWY